MVLTPGPRGASETSSWLTLCAGLSLFPQPRQVGEAETPHTVTQREVGSTDPGPPVTAPVVRTSCSLWGHAKRKSRPIAKKLLIISRGSQRSAKPTRSQMPMLHMTKSHPHAHSHMCMYACVSTGRQGELWGSWQSDPDAEVMGKALHVPAFLTPQRDPGQHLMPGLRRGSVGVGEHVPRHD